MGRKNSVGTANGLPNGERAGGAAAGSGAPVPCHLLVMRTSAMGDVAMLPHALRALTAAYPDLRVTVATQAMFRPFFAGLDVGFLDVDVKGAHHSLAGMMAAGRPGPEAGRGRRGRRARRAALEGVPPRDASARRSGGAYRQGARRETGVHPLRRPRHGAAAPHGVALLRRFPEAGIRAGRPRARRAPGPPQSLRGETRRVGGLRTLLRTPGQDLSRGAEPRTRADALGALRAGFHPRRRRRRTGVRRGDGTHVSQRHGACTARSVSPGRWTLSPTWTAW